MFGDERAPQAGKPDRRREPPAWLAPGSALDRAFGRLETMLELGTSALVPLATIALPALLAVLSYFIVPYDLSWRLRTQTHPGDNEYVSVAPYTGFEGDTPPEPEPSEPEPEAAPAPAQGDPDAVDDEGVAEPAPEAEAGPDVPADGGGEPSTSPAPKAGTPSGSPAAIARDTLAKAKAGGRTKRCEPVPNPAIESLGEKRWKLERKMVDYYATHIRALDELGWVTKWKSEDGARKGFRVGGLECGNDAWLAGLRNGDVVLTVNGTKVGSILEGIAAYAKHRKADLISLEILRKEEIRFHTYRMH